MHAIADYKELDEILGEYDKIIKKEGIKSSVIILDDVTFPKEWFKSIKYSIDMGKFNNDVLILSGSLSMEAKSEIETSQGEGERESFHYVPITIFRIR